MPLTVSERLVGSGFTLRKRKVQRCLCQSCTNPGHQATMIPKIFIQIPGVFFILFWWFCIFAAHTFIRNLCRLGLCNSPPSDCQKQFSSHHYSLFSWDPVEYYSPVCSGVMGSLTEDLFAILVYQIDVPWPSSFIRMSSLVPQQHEKVHSSIKISL
jgi:hypothetical protein